MQKTSNTIVKDATNSNVFLNADEVASLLKVSKSSAYNVIRSLNQELHSQGYFTVTGKISSKYLFERTNI